MTNSEMEARQKQIIDDINELTGNDKAKAKEFAKVLRSGAENVATSLINIGKSQAQTTTDEGLRTLKEQIRQLTEESEQKDGELAEMRSKAPEAAAVEEATRQKWEKKVRKAEGERDEAQRRFNDALVQVAIDKAVALLITPNEQGIRADKEYAEMIAAGKLRPHIIPKPDGSLGVKQIGEESEYDGDTLDHKIASLVKDFRPYIPPTFMMSNADSGAGVRNGAGSGSAVSGGKKTLEQIIAQKLNDPAFAGM